MEKQRISKVVFIGYRGTGKTVLSRMLAEKLEWELLNTDETIQKKAGLAIPQIVEKFGWPYFRNLEKELAAEISGMEKAMVVDTGGGMVTSEEAAASLKKNSVMVLLEASKEKIFERISTDSNRPSLIKGASQMEEITQKLAERTPIYKKLADFTVDTSTEEPEESLKRMLEFLKAKGVSR
ncbi:MAG: shikimate kinase [Candidatus Diapherotrites archaeon]|nr:shikimate kinase [Candidatus Diapherotrites archaeon]